jgi:hypothetical protein
MIDKTYWKMSFACNPQNTSAEFRCKFRYDSDFRNEVLDSIPEDKMEEMKEIYIKNSKYKNLSFEEWFDFVRRTGIIIPVSEEWTDPSPYIILGKLDRTGGHYRS